MSLHMRLRRVEAQLALLGRCRHCWAWPPPVVRLLDAGDPAAEEDPPHIACARCGWSYSGTHTVVIEEQIVSAQPGAASGDGGRRGDDRGAGDYSDRPEAG